MLLSLKSFVTLCALTCLLAVTQTQAKPAPRQTEDVPPKLSDTLAVAKSPFEPVTLAAVSHGPRNDEIAETGSPALLHSTRSTQSFEQERDSTASVAGNDSITPEASSVTEAITSESTTEALTTIAATELPETDSTTAASGTEAETDATTTTSRPETTEQQPAESSTAISSSSSSTQPPEVSSAPSVSEERDQNDDKAETTTEVVKSSSELASTTSPPDDTESSKKPETDASTSAPVEQPTTETTPEPVDVASEPPSSPSTTTTTTSDVPVSTTTTTTAAPTTTTETITTTPTVDTTTSESPKLERITESPEVSSTPQTTTTEQPSSPVPSVSSTETPEPPTSTTESPKPNETDKTDPKEGKSSASCNHLPTYEADEVQKVFREETTYKNGTIKGKFTYINFDQRYRLVHYTRLPYGPVKIDLVEELAKPDQSALGNRTTASSSLNDVPNAVLQLRNILPNSLYGFPFLSPNSNLPLNSRSSPEQKSEVDKSNMYLYHTDSVSNSNAMIPSIPVSVAASLRKLGQGADTLGPSYYENFSVGPPVARSDLANEGSKHQVLTSGEPMFGGPNHHQFQYAGAPSQIIASSPEPRAFYTYLSQPNYHQYSPLPIYSFNQPTYFASRQTLAPPATVNAGRMRHEPSHSEAAFVTHQSHQPHSHEHFMAPFMYAHPPTIHGDQLDSSRLRLKVKTSKSLDYDGREPVGKSAQLRAPTKTNSSPTIHSPAQVHRYQYTRQRSGKQNHELTKTSPNTSPVVYHVLRSPVGRMYNLPQYDSQAYSMAYDS